MKINVGIIGVGYWGPNYVRVFNELPDSNILYACDIDEKKLNFIKKINSNIRTTKNYKELLADPEIKSVVVSTPASSHYKLVKECLEDEKDVLVEKPITLNSKEAEELIELAREKNRILMVGHTFEYNPAVIKLKDYITKKEFGDIQYIYCIRTGLGPLRKDVNAMWDLMPHDISMLLSFLGEMPIEVSAAGQDYLQKGVEDVVFMFLRFPKNVVAHIHASWLDPYKIREVTVVGSKKMAVFNDIDKSETLKIFDKGVEKYGDKLYPDFGEFQMAIRDGDIYIPKIEGGEPLKNQCSHFINCVIKRARPLTSGEEGERVVRILEAAQKSLKNKGEMVRI